MNSLKDLKTDAHKKVFTHLIALHTGNQPSAIESSLKAKDGFAKKKINTLHPKVIKQIVQSAKTHGDLMKEKE
jgi:hypothetical protein